MPGSRRGNSLRPINSQKHENTFSFLGQNASSTQTVNLIVGTERGTIATATPEEVQIGAVIKWIYIEFNLNGVDNSTVAQIFHWMILKNPNSQISGADPALYNKDFKSKILKRGMEMLPQNPIGSGGVVQTKRIFIVKIPKGLQRFGQNDKLQFIYKSTSASAINICGIHIFKEYT